MRIKSGSYDTLLIYRWTVYLPGVDVAIGENALKQKQEQKNVNTTQPQIKEIPTSANYYLM